MLQEASQEARGLFLDLLKSSGGGVKTPKFLKPPNFQDFVSEIGLRRGSLLACRGGVQSRLRRACRQAAASQEHNTSLTLLSACLKHTVLYHQLVSQISNMFKKKSKFEKWPTIEGPVAPRGSEKSSIFHRNLKNTILGYPVVTQKSTHKKKINKNFFFFKNFDFFDQFRGSILLSTYNTCYSKS